MIRVTLVGLACIFACISMSGCNSNRDESNSNTDLENVRVITPKRKPLQRTTTQPATIRADEQADIYARVSGFLKKLNADIGKQVAKGELLAEISVPEMKIARERQEAKIAQLKAIIKRTKAEVELAEASVEVAKEVHAQSDFEEQKAIAQRSADEAEHKRVEGLVAKKVVEQRLLDEMKKRLESSQSGANAAKSATKAAKAKIGVAIAKSKVAVVATEVNQKELAIAEKELAEMDTMLAFAKLEAPFTGVVTDRNVDVGDLVRNTQTDAAGPKKPLFRVAKIDKVRIEVAIPENDAPLATHGKPAMLRCRTFPGKTFKGTISRTASSLDDQTRTMLVEIDLSNKDRLLLPGMYGECTIILQNKENAIVLPAETVHFDESSDSYVYVVESGDTIRRVVVQTGLDNGKEIEIIRGLDGSESVVGPFIGTLTDGQKVKVLAK